MSETKFLLIDDENEQSELLKSAIDEINAESGYNQLSFHTVNTPEDAMIALYSYSFQAIIIDLKLLAEDDTVNNDEEISGNILLNRIIEKEIIPIVIKVIVYVYPKEDPLYDIIKELISSYSDSVF